jgi:hypothetical protein
VFARYRQRAAEPIELNLAGQTHVNAFDMEMREVVAISTKGRGPGTSCVTLRNGNGVVATATLDLCTNSRESFKPSVSHRAITHFDEDAIGLGVWIPHLELEHVLVAWHHRQLCISKRHAENSVVELCATDKRDEASFDTQ